MRNSEGDDVGWGASKGMTACTDCPQVELVVKCGGGKVIRDQTYFGDEVEGLHVVQQFEAFCLL